MIVRAGGIAMSFVTAAFAHMLWAAATLHVSLRAATFQWSLRAAKDGREAIPLQPSPSLRVAKDSREAIPPPYHEIASSLRSSQ